MQISLENLQAGNVVVLRNGTEHVIESVIFTTPVQLLTAEDREKFHTAYLKFAEEPFDVSHLYGLNGNFALLEDMRDIVKIHNTTPQVHVLNMEDIGVLATYLNKPPSVKQVLDQINQNVPVKNPLTMETPTGKGNLRIYLISNYEEYNAPTLGELIKMFLSGEYEELNVEDYILTLTVHELEKGLWQ